VALQLKAAPDPSTTNTPAPATSAPGPSAPTLVDQRQNGVAEAVASKDEDTYSGLIFKRKRKVDVAVPANSTSNYRAPSYREHPPSSSCPRDLVVQEGRGESASGGDSSAPLADLPAFLQRVLQSFQDQERMESMDEDPLQEHTAKCLGDFFIASSLIMTKMQKLKEAASQDAHQIKRLKHRENALYLEAADLHKAELAAKKLLFEKSQEAIVAHAKVLYLRTEVIGLKEEVAQSKQKYAKLEEE